MLISSIPSPPRKRKALLLGPAEPGDVPEANRFKYKPSKVGKLELDIEPAVEDEETAGADGADDGGDGDGDGEDEFAQMVSHDCE